MPPKRKAQDDNATPKRVTRRRQLPIADDEPDELNLSFTKPQVAPPATPGPRPGAPRVVIDCIEITTPRSFGRVLRSNAACASPTTNGSKLKATPAHRAPSTPSRQLRPGPASPLKSIQVPSTPSRVRPLITPRASPLKIQLNDVPATPSKRASRQSSPRKGGDLPAPVKLPSVLSSHLVPCLRLQKRAILGALQSESLSLEDIDDPDHSSTNSTAYTQLHELLHGTTTRGEGNSCLLLGPRGSGKTSVRLSRNQ